MKKISVLAAFFCLLFATSEIFAQNKATNFAGNWELNVAKSKLPERSRIEAMTMNVTQSDKELKVETNTKRAAGYEGNRPAGDGNGGMRPGGGMGRGGGGMMGGGNGMVTYSLDGKEMVIESETPSGMSPTTVSIKAETENDGKLKLTSSRSINNPNGSMNIKTTDIWELLDGGKTLKVTRDTETPRGTQSTEMYFTKSDGNAFKGTVVSGNGAAIPEGFSGKIVQGTRDSSLSGTSSMPKGNSAGFLNGKAKHLALPTYPPAARAVKASGVVNVQVTIDEKGNVISASAISGHPLLRAAAEEAARNSTFPPTLLQGIPVKVTGVVVFNFVP